MDIWWLHLLVFIFGYTTCKTFYFLNSTRVSLKLLKSARVAYLVMAVRAVEHYKTGEAFMQLYLEKTEAAKPVKQSFEIRFEEETRTFKKSVIRSLLAVTPEVFRETVGFHDWPSAMLYLQEHRAEALNFWRISE